MDAVRFFKYDPATKKHVEYAALVVNERTVEGNDKPVLTVVHLKDDAASHAAVAGVGWEQAFERTLDVPHKSDGPEQAFYYEESKYATSTEGKDEALQAMADEKAVKVPEKTLPTAADLDKVSADAKAKIATSTPAK